MTLMTPMTWLPCLPLHRAPSGAFRGALRQPQFFPQLGAFCSQPSPRWGAARVLADTGRCFGFVEAKSNLQRRTRFCREK